MKNILQQLQKALAILEDYPGIEKTIDLSEAMVLLQKMEGIFDVPSMEEAKIKVAGYQDEMKKRLKKWEKKFDKLPLTGSVIDCTEESGWEKDTLLYVTFCSSQSKEEMGEYDYGLSLCSDNRAVFHDIEEFSEEYTWEEAYNKLSEYVRKRTCVPE